MRAAIQKVLTDDGFSISSESSIKARKTAEKLLEWCSGPENQTLFGCFAFDLILHINTVSKSTLVLSVCGN